MTTLVVNENVFLMASQIRISPDRLNAAMARSKEYFNDYRLAKAIKANPSRIADWRNGVHLPSAENLILACKLLGITPQYLFGEENKDMLARVESELRDGGRTHEAEALRMMAGLSPAQRDRLVDRMAGWVDGLSGEAERRPLLPYDEARDDAPLNESRGARTRRGVPAAKPAPSSERRK